MLFSELLEVLTYGELSDMAISGNGEAIEPPNYKKIASHTNLALAALYARFAIREDEAIIQQYDAINTYYLRPQYALNSGSAEPTKYLVDTALDPFPNNVLGILSVHDEAGAELPLNDADDETSVFTPSFDAIQITTPNAANSLSVIYQASHDKIVVDATTDPTTVQVEVPPILVDPLAAFIAARCIGPVGKDGLSQSAQFMAKYEFLVKQVESQGLFLKDNQRLDPITSNGWV